MTEQRIDVSKVLDEAPLNGYHWRIVLLGSLMMMLDGYDLSVMGLALPAVSEAWKVEASLFRWALSASLIGVGVGSVISGFMGDRLGRKGTLLTMYVLGSLACLGTVTATDVPQLVVWRFLVGVGMGGAIPNVISLISELMPVKRRPLLIVLVYSGAALGGAIGSLLASVIIPDYGWTSVFYVGGLLPLFIAAMVWKAVPESPAYLIAQGRLHPLGAATVIKLQPGFPAEQAQRLFVGDRPAYAKTGLGALFSEGRATSTALIWVLFICTQAMVFFVQSWYVTLLTRGGHALDSVLRTFSLWDFGALMGGIVLAWMASRFPLERLLALAYGVAAACLFALGTVRELSALTSIVTFVTGFSVVGASFCMGALAASYYPSAVRATGVGMGLGIGRVGSILSPILAGSALAAGWTNEQIFMAAMVPAGVAGIAVWVLSVVGQRQRSAGLALSQQDAALQ
ncbi:MAG: MFS transporter [Betaproteobacteria bacterium]|jgi:AAHS family 4-hydroxybenzoate transporter-like MFS transporter